MGSNLRTSQAPAFAATESEGLHRSSQLFMFAAASGRELARYVRTSQAALLTPGTADGLTRTSQAFAMVAYGVGARENFRLRAWGFTLDGHKFYVLNLGMLGTWVYDLGTRQWARWFTFGMETWNAENGLMWNGRIIAGDNQNPILWEVDPTTDLDDGFKPIERTVTAMLVQRSRNFAALDEIAMVASVGYPTEGAASLTLTYSDDNGATWVSPPDGIVALTTDKSQNLQWVSLGSFARPGRIIDITDLGGFVRIDDALYEARGLDAAAQE